MQDKTNELLTALLGQIENKSDLDTIQSELFKRGVESLLKAEMTAHLGHQNGHTPKDNNIRNGYSFKIKLLLFHNQ